MDHGLKVTSYLVASPDEIGRCYRRMMRDLLGVNRTSSYVTLIGLTQDRVERLFHIEVYDTVAQPEC